MNELLGMAQNFERNSKQQAENTRQVVSNEFNKLNKFINTEVQKSAKETRNAIQELQRQHLNNYKKTKLLMLVVMLIASFTLGMFTQVKAPIIKREIAKEDGWIICKNAQQDEQQTIYCEPKTVSFLNPKELWRE